MAEVILESQGMVVDPENKCVIRVTDRERAEKSLLVENAMSLTKDEFVSLQKELSRMSDAEFENFVKSLPVNDRTSLKERINNGMKLQNEKWLQGQERASAAIPMMFLTEEENEALKELISKSKPSDSIRLSCESIDKLTEIWSKSADGLVSIPSDVFFANTIPLLDALIDIDTGDGMIYSRVVIFSDYQERIEAAEENSFVMVGAIVHPLKGSTLLVPLEVVRGVDHILMSEFGYHNLPKESREAMTDRLTMDDMTSYFSVVMKAWYGIQIALLHPQIKSVFQNPSTIAVSPQGTKKKHKHGKRKTVYVKRHVINADDLVRTTAGASVERHTLVWYVIGHWRTYKTSGKKIFIKPYWKGPLRELKHNLDERERVIPIPANS